MSASPELSDGPFTRVLVRDMTADQLERHLAGIRERRMRMVRVYQAALERTRVMRHEKLQGQLATHIRLLEKELARIDKTVEKAEDRLTKIRATMLEADEYIPDVRDEKEEEPSNAKSP